MSDERQTVLVTGASAGIGEELARVFAKNGHNVVLVARSKDKLTALARELRETHGVTATVIAMDLAGPEAAGKLEAALERKRIAIDILVNNAGMALVGAFQDVERGRHMALLQLNVVTLTELTHRLLGPMIERGHGRILNVASIVSFFPTPSFALYGASKAYVLSFSEALSQDLRGTGVTVTALCPGYTETSMISQGFADMGKKGLETKLPSLIKLTPAAVAREGYKACMKGKAVHVDRLSNDLAAQWIRLQPKWLVRNVGGLLARFAR